MVDVHHYVAACYADVLVSRDGPFAEIIGLIPAPRIRPMTLDDFAKRYLGRS